LGGEPDRGIGGAEALIVASLGELEEEALLEHMRFDLEEFAVAFAVGTRPKYLAPFLPRRDGDVPAQGRLIV
jgi:hypothetical protein